MATTSSPPEGPQRDRLHWLASCTGSEHREAVTDLLVHAVHGTPDEAAAEAAALASNPCTDVEDFAAVVTGHLQQWVGYPRPEAAARPEYAIPVDAPGERATEWWPELALLDTDAMLGVRLGWWQDLWRVRQAFAVADPAQWARLYRRFARDPGRGPALARWLIAMLRHRSLPQEQPLVLAEPSERQQALLSGWDGPWHPAGGVTPDASLPR